MKEMTMKVKNRTEAWERRKRKKGLFMVKKKTCATARRSSSTVIVPSYTDSSDSIEVAKLIGSFQYRPEKREEILQKYEDLLKRNPVR